MLGAAGTALWLGVAAERRSLEDVAAPLCAIDEPVQKRRPDAR
jgi:hypothetical protein